MGYIFSFRGNLYGSSRGDAVVRSFLVKIEMVAKGRRGGEIAKGPKQFAQLVLQHTMWICPAGHRLYSASRLRGIRTSSFCEDTIAIWARDFKKDFGWTMSLANKPHPSPLASRGLVSGVNQSPPGRSPQSATLPKEAAAVLPRTSSGKSMRPSSQGEAQRLGDCDTVLHPVPASSSTWRRMPDGCPGPLARCRQLPGMARRSGRSDAWFSDISCQ